LPLEVMVDVSKMDIGDRWFLKDLKLPASVKVKFEDEFKPIIKIAGKGRQ